MELLTLPHSPLSVKTLPTGVSVTEGDLRIELGKNGPNNLIDLKSAYFKRTILFSSRTDWIGPYATSLLSTI